MFVIRLSSVASANTVDAVVGMEGSVVVSAVWKETLHDRRNSNWCDSKHRRTLT
jgi:hypothetical protein